MYIIPKYNKIDDQVDYITITSILYGNAVKISQKNLFNEFWQIYNDGCIAIDSELKSFLYENGFLIAKEKINDDLEKIYNYMNSILQIMILPTEACNFRCPYCYEDHKGTIMNSHIIDNIKTFIRMQMEKYHFSHIYLYWFGGEPTLCTKIIFELNNFIINLQKDYVFEFNSSMATNGYLLDRTMFQKFYSYGIKSYEITLDGWNHDKTRPYINGSGTLNVIFNNLVAISKFPSELKFTIVLRHNVLANDDDLSWYDYLYQNFGDDRRFSLLIKPVENYGINNEERLPVLSKKEQKEMIFRHINYAEHLGFKVNNKESVYPLSGVCYSAYKYSYIFRESGDIVKCSIDLNNPLNKIGFVDIDTGVHIFEDKNDRWISSSLEDGCYDCSHLLSCLNLHCPRSHILGKRNCNYRDGIFI